MRFLPTDLPEVILLEPEIYSDDRGFFMETYQANKFAEVGIPTDFVQDNISGSRRGVLRGLHYQIQRPQAKLVRVTCGEIFDVAVDIRRSSPTFGKWAGIHLSSENKRQVFIPIGFAHGFYVLSEWSEVFYKASDYYSPEWERTLFWNDDALAIQWPLSGKNPPMLSEKDVHGLPLSQADLFE
jgi:dTDP-4-dehydrorhamnose 3,5-epimerase